MTLEATDSFVLKKADWSRLFLTRLLVDLPLSVVYFAALVICFRYLSFFFGYQLYNFDPNPFLLPIVAMCLLFTAIISPHKKSMHGFAMSMLIYGLWIPVLVWFFAGNGPSAQVAITGLVTLMIRGFGFVVIPRPVHPMVSYRWIVASTIGFAGSLALWALMKNGLSSVNFLIYDVYLFRRDSAANLPVIFQYLWPQVANAMIPLAVALCLVYRQRTGFILLCGISIFLFAVVHHKGVLFTPFFAAIIYYFFHKRDDLFLFKAAFVFVAVVCSGEALVREMWGMHEVGDLNVLLSRRVLLVPAQLDSLYIEYFSVNPKIIWATSKITFGLIESPYPVTAPFIIGEHYFGHFGTSSNTGLIGAGYANAGIFGVLIYTIVLGFGLCLLEAHARALGHSVVITSSILILNNAFTASDTITLMLTGGFGCLIVLLSILKVSK